MSCRTEKFNPASPVEIGVIEEVSWLTSSALSGIGDSVIYLSSVLNPLSVARAATVTISGSNFVPSVSVHVFQSGAIIDPASISLSLSDTTLVLGDGLDLYAEVLPLSATNKGVVWSSSDSSVARVVDGHVLARSLGTVSIRAITEIGSHIDSCVITVISPDVPIDDPVDDPTGGIIIVPVAPVDPDSPIGFIDLSFPIPADASFATSFIVTLPIGFELDKSISVLSLPYIANTSYRTSLFPFSWLFSITPKSSSGSAASINLQSSATTRPIVTIGYTTSVSLPVCSHTMKISDLVATFSDGTSLHRSEILVSITTVSTYTLLLPDPTVIVSLSSAILSVTSPSFETLTIYSLSGNLLYHADKEQGSASINVGHLPRGVLIMRGSSGWTRKTIRQ